MTSSAGTSGNGHHMEHRKLCLIIRKHFCDVQVMELWHTLPTEAVEIFLEIFKSCQNTSLGNLLTSAFYFTVLKLQIFPKCENLPPTCYLDKHCLK